MNSKFRSQLTRRSFMSMSGGAVAAGMLPSFSCYGQDPTVRKDLVFRTTHPRNAEPALEKLVQSWITPTRHFYVRSHAPNPTVDLRTFRLHVEGLVRKPMSISLEELLDFRSVTTTATLTCAGNRRAEFNAEGKVGGVQWEAGAIGNATWEGVPLANILKKAEVLEGARHVWFEGLDQIQRGDDVIPFGGSIPIEKAMQTAEPTPGALLVHKMNGAGLTPDHGYPLRTVVPGYIGARSVKWLGRIVVSDRPSPNHYLATAYKLVKKTGAIDWAESGPIYRYPVNAAICVPLESSAVAAGELDVAGYVLPSGRPGARAKEVLLSADEGTTWTPATVAHTTNDYCWSLWSGKVNIGPTARSILVRASDTAGGFMPRRVPWNAKGYLQNSWYRMPIRVG